VRINRPEAEFLLCCARTVTSKEMETRIRALLQEEIDWEYLLRTAHRHGLAPLVYWHLDAVCPKAVPENALSSLRDHFRANNLRNLSMTGELLRLLDAFNAHGVPAVPYKGPALAASVYGNLALREFMDLDILVHRRDVSRAKGVLASMGYQARYPVTRAQEEILLQTQFEHIFTRDDGKVVVELHWELTERHFLPFETERLWGRLETVSLGGKAVPTFSPEDMLLILCVHGAKHAWERLGWVCDVAELLRTRQKDARWEGTMAQATALGGERMLLLGLYLANDLLGATLPERVAQRVRADSTVKVLAGRIREELFLETDRAARNRPVRSLEGYEGAPAFHPLHLSVKGSLREKIRYFVLKSTRLTAEDWSLWPLPRFLFPFYYVLRLMRLTRKYGSRILKPFS
jgi:hypothetical protein